LVRDITVVSPAEITWRMEEAFAPYLSFLTETFVVPKHILEKEADPNNAAFNQAPIGTGAFKWGTRVPGDRVELVANSNYFGDGPYIERLIFKYIPDLTVLYTQFKSGDVDLVGQTYITPDHYDEARKLPSRVVTLEPKSSFESFYLNLERPQFKELQVRQALYAAIDKKAIIDGLYYGVPTPTETFMPRQSFYYNPGLPVQEFSVKRAQQILDANKAVIATDANAQLVLGHVQASRNENGPALAAYQQALALDPELETNEKLRAALRAMAGGTQDYAVVAQAFDLWVGGTSDPEATKQLLRSAVHDDLARRKAVRPVIERRKLGDRVEWLQAYSLDLQQDTTCEARREAVAKLYALGDQRAVAALERAKVRAGKPVNVHGKITYTGANACLVDDAKAAIRYLRGLTPK
jgi:tetratricopeptide (TPR) repeat protein